MSFLKNLRSTISRKNSVRSKNDIHNTKIKVSAKESDKKSATQDKTNPEKLKSECVLRSDTFTIIDESGNILIKEETAAAAAVATTEIKRSEKNMFSKFGTFSRKKKNKTEKKGSSSIEQSTGWYRVNHGSEATIPSNPPVNDPFNILYEQNTVPYKKSSASVEYGTYRKNKFIDNANEKSESLQLESKSTKKPQEDSDKFKTVTLKSFRKSFRDRFLTQQKDVPYNPAWFIEVEPPVSTKKDEENEQELKQKELLVFENENYRPTARSPVRNIDRSPSRSKTPVRSPSRKVSNAKPESRSRSSTRSSNRGSMESKHTDIEKSSYVTTSHYSSDKPTVAVKRNETFRIERDNLEPSIRIEIRNSISPNEPGRFVPVGVAKPMMPLNSNGSEKVNAEVSDRYMTDQNHRSRSSNVKKNYQTKIHITPSNSQQEKNRLATSYRSNESANKTASAIQTSNKRSKPILENYLPLTSYELLTKMRPRSAVIADKNLISGKSQNLRYVSSQSSKSLDQPTTLNSTRKQKTSIHIGDNSGVVIREVEDGTRCEECKNICAGYKPHEWRKTCQSCKCPREAHAIYQEQLTSVRERLGFKSENQSSGIDPRQLGYTWVPQGVMTSAKIQRYFDKIPQDKVPKIGTSGERYREKQLTYQLPKQDLSKEYCKHLQGAQQQASYEDFVAARNEIALDIGYIKDATQNTKCINCNERISKGELAVIAPKFLDTMMWHPECFCCTTCDELLVDLTYCVHEDKIYCERHYAEMLKPRCSACDEDTMIEKEDQSGISDKEKNVSMYETMNEIASPPTPADFTDASIHPNENQNSSETDENVVHDQQTDALIETLSSPLRKSPRQDDMEQYEENFIENEKKNSRTPSPRGLELKTDEAPEQTSESGAYETSEQNLKDDETLEQKPEHDTNLTDFREEEIINQNTENSDTSQPPKIEIDYAPNIQSNEIQSTEEDDYADEKEHQSSVLMEGVSDFYDFNASANSAIIKSRSQSRSRDSITPPSYIGRSFRSKSRESSPRIKIESKAQTTDLMCKDISGISDWYDYNVMLNQQAYGMKNENNREIHETSTDYIISQLKSTNEIRGKTENLEKASENLNIKSAQTPTDQNEEPPTPQYPRSFSAEWQDTERMKDEYKQQFKRSTYVGESADFSDEFEELREQTRHFRRSRSKSRTPNDKDVENVHIGRMAMRRKLQEKILAQITKTTLDYQDFAKDINSEFLDHERRGSDSALLQKSEILIQFQDNQLKNGDNNDVEDLESEEYHHFRRFSLNQEAQVEEYPEDGYMCEYIKEVGLKKGEWMSEASSTEQIPQVSMLTTNEIADELSTQVNVDDQEDSGSDDERQTVVEVEDEIDEDIWDYDKSDDFNEQSECEEAEREADRYVNRSAGDWKEEGAVGGVSEWENKFEIENENLENIDEIYDEAIKHTAEGKIEKDYENIIKSMNTEDQIKAESADNVSAKTEDLLEEILLNDDRKYRRISPRNSTKIDIKSSTQNFIDEEKENVEYYISTATVVHHDTKATRLRSRYGLPPSTQFRNFDYEVDDIDVDLNYKPKKEYNWRKNFKIDDDNDEDQTNGNQNQETDDTDSQDYKLEEENIYSHSNIENENQDFQIQSLNNISYSEQSQLEITTSKSEHIEESSYQLEEYEEIQIQSKEVDFVTETEQSEIVSKKKKSKKSKNRKGSKASLGEENISNLTNIEITPAEDDQGDSSSKKKLKKKKKTKTDSTNKSEYLSPNYNSPEPENKSTVVKKSESPDSKFQHNAVFDQPKVDESKTSTRISPSTEVLEAKAKSPEDMRMKSQSPVGASGIQKNIEDSGTKAKSPQRSNTKSPEDMKMKSQSPSDPRETQKRNPTLERTDSSGVYDLIKDGSMYPWFS